MPGFVIDIYVEWIFRVVLRFIREFGTGGWPVCQAKITGAFCPKIGYGCARAVVNYAYSVDGKRYMGTNVKPFVILNTAEIYAAQFPKGKTVSLRVKPSNPDFSVLLDSENDVKRYIV